MLKKESEGENADVSKYSEPKKKKRLLIVFNPSMPYGAFLTHTATVSIYEKTM